MGKMYFNKETQTTMTKADWMHYYQAKVDIWSHVNAEQLFNADLILKVLKEVTV